jgi:23S rRNA (pseudouridine1915-N3)-methyltransferase
MRLKLLSIGRDRSGLFEPAVQEYAGRIRKLHEFDLLELKEAPTPEKEAEALLAKLSPRDVLVCLDERGQQLSSPELAALLAKWRDSGRDVAFAIGGDSGHAAVMRERAQFTWSLSKLVLPHRLARVVVAEQIYRAFTILRGEPYHK